jgi:hypothetical protein
MLCRHYLRLEYMEGTERGGVRERDRERGEEISTNYSALALYYVLVRSVP